MSVIENKITLGIVGTNFVIGDKVKETITLELSKLCGIEEFSNPLEVDGKKIVTVTQVTTLAELEELLNKNIAELREKRIETITKDKTLPQGEVKEELQKLKKPGTNVIEHLDKIIIETTGNIFPLLDVRKAELQNRMDKLQEKHLALDPRHNTTGDYSLSHIDTLVLHQYLDHNGYIKVLRLIKDKGSTDDINLKNLADTMKIIGKNNNIYLINILQDINIKTLKQVTKNIQYTIILSKITEPGSQNIITGLSKIKKPETINTFLQSIGAYTASDLLNTINNMEVVIEVLEKDPSAFAEKFKKYEKKGEITKFVRIVEEKKRLPNMFGK